MLIDIVGYVTELHGKSGFKIKVTSDKVSYLSVRDIQVSKEVRIFIKPYLYPSNDESEFRKITQRDDPRIDKINEYCSLSDALKPGDRVKCSVYMVETEIRNGQEIYTINNRRRYIKTYPDFDLWLCFYDSCLKRLEADSKESLKFRKQWHYTCRNRGKYKKITGDTLYGYRDKKWVNKNPKIISPILWGIRFRTAATKLWKYYKDPKNTTITRIIATISPLIALASLILNIWLFFFRKP